MLFPIYDRRGSAVFKAGSWGLMTGSSVWTAGASLGGAGKSASWYSFLAAVGAGLVWASGEADRPRISSWALAV